METTLSELVLGPDDCWALVRSTELGRLVVVIHNEPFIFLVNHLVDDGKIVFQTGDATKLDGVCRNRHVAFEVDGADEDGETSWSVVVSGWAAPVLDPDRIASIEARAPDSWDSSTKPYLIEVHPEEVRGTVSALEHGVI